MYVCVCVVCVISVCTCGMHVTVCMCKGYMTKVEQRVNTVFNP